MQTSVVLLLLLAAASHTVASEYRKFNYYYFQVEYLAVLQTQSWTTSIITITSRSISGGGRVMFLYLSKSSNTAILKYSITSKSAAFKMSPMNLLLQKLS